MKFSDHLKYLSEGKNDSEFSEEAITALKELKLVYNSSEEIFHKSFIEKDGFIKNLVIKSSEKDNDRIDVTVYDGNIKDDKIVFETWNIPVFSKEKFDKIVASIEKFNLAEKDLYNSFV